MGRNTHENQTHKNLYTHRISNSNCGWLRSPTKIYPLENLTHKILGPRKFLRLRYNQGCKEVLVLGTPIHPEHYSASANGIPEH